MWSHLWLFSDYLLWLDSLMVRHGDVSCRTSVNGALIPSMLSSDSHK